MSQSSGHRLTAIPSSRPRSMLVRLTATSSWLGPITSSCFFASSGPHPANGAVVSTRQSSFKTLPRAPSGTSAQVLMCARPIRVVAENHELHELKLLQRKPDRDQSNEYHGEAVEFHQKTVIVPVGKLRRQPFAINVVGQAGTRDRIG